MKSSRSLRPLVSALAIGLLSIQAGLDRAFGHSLIFGMGADAPVTAAAIVASATGTEKPATESAAVKPAAEAPAAVVTPPPASTLRGFIQSLRSGAATGSELVTARQSVTTLTTERDQARQQVTTLTAQVNAFAGFFGITAAELAAAPAAEITKLIGRKISDQAAEQVAAIGIPASELPSQSRVEGAAETLEELQAAMATEKDLKKLGQLAAKANALRDKQWGKN